MVAGLSRGTIPQITGVSRRSRIDRMRQTTVALRLLRPASPTHCGVSDSGVSAGDRPRVRSFHLHLPLSGVGGLPGARTTVRIAALPAESDASVTRTHQQY